MVLNTDQNIKGIYLARLDLGVQNHLGILSKINGQCAALENALGPVATYFANGLTLEKDNESIASYAARFAAGQRFHQYGFYNLVKQQSLQADYFYIRYQLCNPSFLSLLKSLRMHNPNAPIMVEIPTYPYDLEQTGFNQKIKFLQDSLTRNHMAGLIDNIVTFSRAETIFGISTIKTQNGIALEQFPPVQVAAQNDCFNLVGVANVSHWHGYDRVITGLRSYYDQDGDMDVQFTIIGEGAAVPQLKQMVTDMYLQDHVHFLGARMGEDLTSALTGQHMGVSSLGTHRVGNDTTVLKSREFCARGLPFMNSHDEADIAADFPFAHTVPYDDSPVDIGAAIAFHKSLRQSHGNYATDLRNFAADRLTWDRKMVPVIDRIKTLIAEKRIQNEGR